MDVMLTFYMKRIRMLTTAFRVDNLSADDMAQVAAFKRMVKNSLMMDNLLSK